MDRVANTTFDEPNIHNLIYGWVDYKDDTDFSVELKHVRKS